MTSYVESMRAGLRLDLIRLEGVGGHLAVGIGHVPDFVKRTPKLGGSLFRATQEVSSLRSKLRRMSTLSDPWIITAQGTFFPCILLCAGWWEHQRIAKAKIEEANWRDDVQRWLYRGFEEWAPSWDVSLSARSGTSPHLFAQLGAGDEANSLLVVIPGEQANLVRDLISNDRMAFQCEVKGVLCHRSHLSRSGEERLGRWGKAFDYCLWLDPDDSSHRVSPLAQTPPIYSGYLWECLAPKVWIRENKSPQLNDVYFIWEHTDFTKPDAIKYNLDSLRGKAKYLGAIHGELVLLQKSSPLVEVDDEAAYPAQDFYNFIMEAVSTFGEGQTKRSGDS